MSHRAVQLAVLMTALAGSGCGGPVGGLGIKMSTKNLSVSLTAVRIDLHTPDRACDDILATGPRVLGSYSKQIDLGAMGALMGSGSIDGILPNSYNVAVWGFVNGAPKAFNCGLVMIQDGTRTIVPVTLMDL